MLSILFKDSMFISVLLDVILICCMLYESIFCSVLFRFVLSGMLEMF